MVAAVNHKCIRLIRTSIEEIEIEAMKPGDVIEMEEALFYDKLHLLAK
jgi:23S rRNA pseudouridine2457 synthase